MSFDRIPDAWLHPAYPYGDPYLADMEIRRRQREWWEDLGLPEAPVCDLLLDPETFVPTHEEVEARGDGVRVRAEATTAEGLKWATSEGFYIGARWLLWPELWIDPNKVWATVTGLPGSGKHSGLKFVVERLVSTFGSSAVLQDRQVVEGSPVAQIKGMYGGEKDLTAITEAQWGFSMMGAMEYIRMVATSPGIKFAISHRGPVGATVTALLAQGKEGWLELIKRTGSADMLWQEEHLAEIAQNKRLMDQGWQLAAEIVKCGRRKDMLPADMWPMFDGWPIPIMIILDRSPAVCWRLQETPSQFRTDVRPHGPHPFTKDDMMIMRLIHGMLFGASPKSAIAVAGKVWDDFNRDKAEREGEAVLKGIAQVYTGWRR